MLDKIERTASAVSSVSSRFSSAVIFWSGSSVSHGGTVENAWKNALSSSSESGLSSFAFTALLTELEQSHHLRGILSSAARAEAAEYILSDKPIGVILYFRFQRANVFPPFYLFLWRNAIGDRTSRNLSSRHQPQAMQSHKASFVINNHELMVTSSKPLPSWPSYQVCCIEESILF